MDVLIVYGTCGHGHKKAAEYIEEELKKKSGINVENLDFLRYTTKFFRISYPLIYRYAVTYFPFLWKIGFYLTDLKLMTPVVRICRKFANRFHAKKFENFIIEKSPDVVVSTHFLPAEIAARLKQNGIIRSKVVTVVTDSIPHLTWINPGTDYYVVLGNAAVAKLSERGVEPSSIKPFGIPIAEKFNITGNKENLLKKYGLSKDKLKILITSGSFGLGPTKKITALLDRFSNEVELMVVCGNNEKLYKDLSYLHYKTLKHVYPFIDFMDELMEVCDVAVAKTGGLTMSESLAKEIPLIISSPIPGQETYNAEFLLDNGAAFYLKKPEDIVKIVKKILSDNNVLAEKIANIRKIKKPFAAKNIASFVAELRYEEK